MLDTNNRESGFPLHAVLQDSIIRNFFSSILMQTFKNHMGYLEFQVLATALNYIMLHFRNISWI